MEEEKTNDIYSSSEEVKYTDKNETVQESTAKEQIIRDYLKIDEISEYSFFNRVMKSNHSMHLENDIAGETVENEVTGEYEQLSISSFDSRKNRNVITCESYIIDPYCELSSSIIRLPATPCTSFSLTKFYLNGTNLSTASKCYCGLKDQEKKFLNFKFEFQHDCPEIKIEPQSGCLEYGKVWNKIFFRRQNFVLINFV